MQTQSKLTISLIVAAAALIGYAAAGPFIVVHRLGTAIQNHDSEGLSDNIDFPSLRSNLKEQFSALMMKTLVTEPAKQNAFAALGTMLASKMVDTMVDSMITPSGLANLMAGKQTSGGSDQVNAPTSHADPFEGSRYSFDSFSKFSIRKASNDGGEVRFVFTRAELTWRLSNIVLPSN